MGDREVWSYDEAPTVKCAATDPEPPGSCSQMTKNIPSTSAEECTARQNSHHSQSFLSLRRQEQNSQRNGETTMSQKSCQGHPINRACRNRGERPLRRRAASDAAAEEAEAKRSCYCRACQTTQVGDDGILQRTRRLDRRNGDLRGRRQGRGASSDHGRNRRGGDHEGAAAVPPSPTPRRP